MLVPSVALMSVYLPDGTWHASTLCFYSMDPLNFWYTLSKGQPPIIVYFQTIINVHASCKVAKLSSLVSPSPSSRLTPLLALASSYWSTRCTHFGLGDFHWGSELSDVWASYDITEIVLVGSVYYHWRYEGEYAMPTTLCRRYKVEFPVWFTGCKFNFESLSHILIAQFGLLCVHCSALLRLQVCLWKSTIWIRNMWRSKVSWMGRIR